MATRPLPPAQRFWSKVEVGSGINDCWLWTAARNRKGYGKFGLGLRGMGHGLAHRIAYEMTYGLIPRGYDVDHLCFTPACVNPWHLEAVTHAENMRRSFQRSPACYRGHTYTGERTTGNRRRCRECERIRDRKRRGFTDPGRSYVLMSGHDFVKLLDDV